MHLCNIAACHAGVATNVSQTLGRQVVGLKSPIEPGTEGKIHRIAMATPPSRSLAMLTRAAEHYLLEERS